MEFGIRPHQQELMDERWRRSPLALRRADQDADHARARRERQRRADRRGRQFYIGLRDVGVETIMVRYPREGHGLREPKHIVDNIDRSIRWVRARFSGWGSDIVGGQP